MSCVQVYKIMPAGRVVPYAEVRNAWGGAIAIWRRLSDWHSIPCSGFSFEPLWSVWGTGRLTLNEDIALGFTFDRVWVSHKNISRVSAALREFWERMQPTEINPTIPGIADTLDALVALGPRRVKGTCFNQTSVNCGVWSVPARSGQSRMFRFGHDRKLRDGAPWELFRVLDAKRKAGAP